MGSGIRPALIFLRKKLGGTSKKKTKKKETKKKSGTGWKIVPMFTIPCGDSFRILKGIPQGIGLDKKDLDFLVQIKAFFKIGNICTSFRSSNLFEGQNKFAPQTSERGIVYYTVSSIKDLIKHILPHFDKYPLATLKLKDYLLFKEIILLMGKGEHNSLPGLLKIFSLKAILNKRLPSSVKTEFPDIIPAIVPELQIPSNFNPHLLSGFITAEGSFFISLYANEKRKAGYSVSLVFSLSQHIKDVELLERLAKFLGCGIVRRANNRDTAEWIITRFDDLNPAKARFFF